MWAASITKVKPNIGRARAAGLAQFLAWSRVQWEFPLKFSRRGIQRADSSSNEGDFYALDATAGRLLWRFQTGARINANPITYLSGGKQHVAIASGNSIFAFALE